MSGGSHSLIILIHQRFHLSLKLDFIFACSEIQGKLVKQGCPTKEKPSSADGEIAAATQGLLLPPGNNDL